MKNFLIKHLAVILLMSVGIIEGTGEKYWGWHVPSFWQILGLSVILTLVSRLTWRDKQVGFAEWFLRGTLYSYIGYFTLPGVTILSYVLLAVGFWFAGMLQCLSED
jgi:hypothetical protein